jgi:pilus assembly protein CpaF
LRGRLFLFFILRPDRIVVGEVRGQEAIDMLQSVNVGHSAMTTVHANSVRNVVSRLETMVLMGMEIPISAIRRQIVEGFDVMVHLGRCKNGRRAVMEVAEPMHIADGEVCMNTVFKRNQQGELVKVGEFTEKTKSKLVRI